jgi:hypothetical protein
MIKRGPTYYGEIQPRRPRLRRLEVYAATVETVVRLAHVEDLQLRLFRRRSRLEHDPVRSEQVFVEPVVSDVGADVGDVDATPSIYSIKKITLKSVFYPALSITS